MLALNKYLIALMTIEIVFGGGGRSLDYWGIPPLRYILFILAIGLFFLNMLTLKIKFTYLSTLLVIVFTSLPIYGVLVGIVNGNPLNKIILDVQPFIYSSVLFFLCFNDPKILDWSVTFFIKTIKIFSLAASVLYIIYILLMRFNVFNYISFYNTVASSTELFFRPSGAFFAKCFFFLAAGAIAFYCEKKIFRLFIIMMAIILTETRGLLLFTCLSLFIASLKINRPAKSILLLIMAALSGALMLFLVGDRGSMSDSTRFEDFTYIINNINDASLLFGNGFGSVINGRDRIEVVPLEMVYKTGFLGIMISLSPILYFAVTYFKIAKGQLSLIVTCILFFAVGVSITNPFIYTPMGFFIIAITINVLSNQHAKFIR